MQLVYADGVVEQLECRVDQSLGRNRQPSGVDMPLGASSPPAYYNQVREQDANPGYARAILRVEDLATLRLTVDGSERWVPAVALGELELRPTLQAITRRNDERVNEVIAFLRQGALPIEVTDGVLQALDDGAIEPPPEYRIDLAGDSAEQKGAISQLLAYAPVLATLMIATLVL